MKTKKFDKKLVLKKETIADITSESMKKVQGGHDSSPTCATFYTCPLVITTTIRVIRCVDV